LASVERARWRWLWDSDLRWLLVRGRSSVFFYCGAEFVKLAVVLAVFGRNALRNRLRAFKLRARIEKAALLAAVKFGIALGTCAAGIEAGDEDGATIGAAGARDGTDHAGSTRAEMIVLSAGTSLGRLAFWAGLLFFIGIAITAMTVLAIHKFLRTSSERQKRANRKVALLRTYTYRHGKGGFRYCTLICIQSDCYTWRRKRYFPKISGSEGTAGIQEQKMGHLCL
jgi:hypothetical protein